MDDRELLTCPDRHAWRAWLEANHRQATEAWLVLHKKGVREGTLTLAEAVEEALCFGWIDGKLKGLDAESYSLRFTPRQPNSIWSLSNIQRVEKLIEQGRMTPAGLEKVAEGRRSGQWEAAIRREQTDVIPPDLERALQGTEGALAAYQALNDSRKKQYLHWLFTAKRPETRARRVEAIVRAVSE